MDEIEELKRRIHNLEVFCVALVTLQHDLLPPAYASDINSMTEEFYCSTDQDSKTGFINKP